MARKSKLRRFADLMTFPNVYQSFNVMEDELLTTDQQKVKLKGIWAKTHFKNDQPITLELACGKGEYTLGLARLFPDKNVIGIDIKGSRIWKGAKTAINDRLQNAAFLRTRIEQIARFFGLREIQEIWITFPDPFLKKENRRLTSPYFLQQYRRICTRNARLHLKTDDPTLYEFTLDVLQQDPEAEIIHHDHDIYRHDGLYTPELDIKTYYEQKHLQEGKTIKYIQFSL